MTDWESLIESVLRFEFLPPAGRKALLKVVAILGILVLGYFFMILVYATHGV